MKLTKKAKNIEKLYSDGEFINIEEQEPMPPPRPFWAVRKENREIKENPTMVINEISRLFNAKMRENLDVGIMTQMSAKIILSVVADTCDSVAAEYNQQSFEHRRYFGFLNLLSRLDVEGLTQCHS